MLLHVKEIEHDSKVFTAFELSSTDSFGGRSPVRPLLQVLTNGVMGVIHVFDATSQSTVSTSLFSFLKVSTWLQRNNRVVPHLILLNNSDKPNAITPEQLLCDHHEKFEMHERYHIQGCNAMDNEDNGVANGLKWLMTQTANNSTEHHSNEHTTDDHFQRYINSTKLLNELKDSTVENPFDDSESIISINSSITTAETDTESLVSTPGILEVDKSQEGVHVNIHTATTVEFV